MTTNTVCTPPGGRCAEQEYRLSVYEAGHALAARALKLRILSVRILPRPPVLVSDKTFEGNNWESFIRTLETRVIELFSGQIAEELVCNASNCCSGDVTRIDELTRLIAGLNDEDEVETVWFGLEEIAEEIFADPKFRAAIEPVAEFLYERFTNGEEEIDGRELDAELDKYVPPLPSRKKGLKRFLAFS